MASFPYATVFPPSATVNARGQIEIAGVDTVELAARFGTPLYVYDEDLLRATCRTYRETFSACYNDAPVEIAYGGKAYLSLAMAALVAEEGLGLDVVSGGEMAVAVAAGFPPQRAYFHGNNKSADELRAFIAAGGGCIVLDNFQDIHLVDSIARDRGVAQKALMRISPGVDPHTHAKTTTGTLDTKFGFAVSTGQAEEGLVEALAAPGIDLQGLHFHLGSPIFETAPYVEAIAIAADFAAAMKTRHGFETRHFSPGGGFAIRYTPEDSPPSIQDYAEAISGAVREHWSRRDLPLPALSIEPGRAIAGPAGVALYTIGASKDIPGVRRYVSVDGGMSDNIRPALYGSRYVATLANRPQEGTETVTIAGKYCESGDVLIESVSLPSPAAGDILAVPATGAYALPMASNYNFATRPAVVFLSAGEARLVRRRETYDDLMATEPRLNEDS